MAFVNHLKRRRIRIQPSRLFFITACLRSSVGHLKGFVNSPRFSRLIFSY